MLVFVGAFAGLFAMHGLSDHGAASHETDGSMNPAVLAISHAGHTADAARNVAGDAWTVDDAPGDDSPSMAIAGLCVAFLPGAVIGLLLLRPRRIVALMRPLTLVFVPVRPSARRDRDPPCLFELSVLRT